MGRDQDAKLDFEKGAALEAVDASNVTLVSRSMERIQGRQRQMIEQYRTVVRAAALARKQATDRSVRQAIAQEELSVRRKVQPIELPANPDVSPSMSSGQKPANDTADVNPFESTPPAQEKRAVPPARQDQQPDASPFEAPPTRTMPKASPPGDDNPFGEAPAKTMPKPADNDNPFGETPKTTPNTKPADSDNPFGALSPSGGRAAPNNPNSGGEQPSPGAISGLYHAFVEGVRPDEPSAPPSDGQGMNIPAMIHGILGGGGQAGPPPGGQDMPTPMPEPTAPAAQAPTTPTNPTPTNPTPPQSTPPQTTPKPSDNPFD
jgi:hypothetical protein